MAKRNCLWIKCTGEAHSNPFIDNCGICAPFWGEFPVCPVCHNSLKRNAKGTHGKTGACRYGHGRFVIDSPIPREVIETPKHRQVAQEPCRRCGSPEKVAHSTLCAPCLDAGAPRDFNGSEHHAHREWAYAQELAQEVK